MNENNENNEISEKTTMEISVTNTTSTLSRETQIKAEDLARRFDKLNKTFGIVESTIDDCTKYVQDVDSDKIFSPDKVLSLEVGEVGEEVVEEVDEFFSKKELLKMLKEDFLEARETLTDVIKTGRTALAAAHTNLTSFEEDSNAELVGSFASLMNSVSQSTKLLLELYNNIVKVKTEIDLKLYQDEKENTSTTNDPNGVRINTVNMIAGNLSDIVKQMRMR